MTRILAFGDSLTWGHRPEDGLRHPWDSLWPATLQAELGQGFTVIADGVCGRATAFDDHTAPCERNATRSLPVAIDAHMPLDLIVIMLGTNDLKPNMGVHADYAARGLARLVHLARTHPQKGDYPVPKLVLVAPPPSIHPAGGRLLGGDFRNDESRRLAPLYQALALETGCGFFDAGAVAEVSPIDGIHMDAANTAGIGRALAAVVRATLG